MSCVSMTRSCVARRSSDKTGSYRVLEVRKDERSKAELCSPRPLMPLVRVAAVSLNQTPLRGMRTAAAHPRGHRDRSRGRSHPGLPARTLHQRLRLRGCLLVAGYPSARRSALLGELLPSARGLAVRCGPARGRAGDGRQCGGASGRWAPRRVRRQATLGARRTALRAALVHAVAKGEAIRCSRSSASEFRLGDVLFEVGGVRLGFEDCEDASGSRAAPGAICPSIGVRNRAQPQRQSFRLRQASDQAAFGRGRRPRLSGGLRLRQLARQRGRGAPICDGDLMIAEPTEDGGSRIVAEGRRLSFRDFDLAVATMALPNGPASASISCTADCRYLLDWPGAPRSRRWECVRRRPVQTANSARKKRLRASSRSISSITLASPAHGVRRLAERWGRLGCSGRSRSHVGRTRRPGTRFRGFLRQAGPHGHAEHRDVPSPHEGAPDDGLPSHREPLGGDGSRRARTCPGARRSSPRS